MTAQSLWQLAERRATASCPGVDIPPDGAFDADGYLRTGDLGSVDADGYLTITGRLKDVIIRKGETVSARAIELELLTCRATRQERCSRTNCGAA
jgi:acyl-CoA synthetase (AMP-forming)/AMP-acid ligase II